MLMALNDYFCEQYHGKGGKPNPNILQLSLPFPVNFFCVKQQINAHYAPDYPVYSDLMVTFPTL